MIGRVLPLAGQLALHNQVHIIGHGKKESADWPSQLIFHSSGRDPWSIGSAGKRRLRGWRLVVRVLVNSWRAALLLFKISPDTVIIVKSLPENVLAVSMWRWLHPRPNIILDSDDFELTANKLTSLTQRAAIHWAERRAVKLAKQIVVATPFLADHFEQLATPTKPITLIPTGLTPESFGSVTPPARRPLVILYAGSLAASSGHRVDMLPEILRLVRQELPATLIIAGSGEDEAELRRAFVQRGLADSVEWTGRFNDRDLINVLSRAPVLIDPIDSSITNRAKSSFRTLLAAATGRPLVTSNVGVRPLLVPAAFHALFFARPGDPQDYAQKIVALLKGPWPAEHVSELQTHFDQYRWANLSKPYEKLL